ncbi:MAG: prephenate dehydrogenase/arogenate dehydrogenase family protein [Gemmatimonadota bacterium]|nr:MAG: prephenate dehydrogenase/arogenate dehydrogenase family protein [Gemmatimonadota bacterium]
MKTLDRLRTEIEEVDTKLLELIAQRLELAVKVGEEKGKMGIPIRDWSVERDVIDRAHRAARRLRLPHELVRKIMQHLIRESCAFQEGLRDATYDGDLGRIFIVGGRGRMGRWFARFFHNQGHFVSIYDKAGFLPQFPSFETLQDGVRDASLILLATPLDETPGVYEELMQLRPAGIMCDIASLKSGLLETIRKARKAQLRVASIHPLFGPEARMLSDKVICLCECGDEESFSEVRALFQETSASLVELPLERHDVLASYVLGLSHILNIIFAHTLSNSGIPYKAFSEVASTTFVHQSATTVSVITENPFLYYEIQNTNAYTPELYKQLRAAMSEITETVLAKDRDRFVDIMKRGEKYFTEVENVNRSFEKDRVPDDLHD